MARIRWFTRTSRIVALCSFANFINSADRVIMPIAIVDMTDIFNWSLHSRGWILSAFAFGYFTSQILGGFWASKLGAKNVLICSVLLWSIATFVTPLLASSITALVVCRIVLGFAEGLGLPTIFHLFAHSIPVEERSRAFSYLLASGSVGQTVASILCPHWSWEACFYWFGSLGFLWVLLWYCLYPEDSYTGEEALPLHMPKVISHNIRWADFILSKPLWAIYTAHFAMNWSSYIIMQWLPTYLKTYLGGNARSLSLTAVPYIVNSIFGVISGHIADGLLGSKNWSVLNVRRLMTSIGLVGPALFLAIFCVVDHLAFAIILVSISMGLSASNSAGHLSNHVDIAPNHAGTTFAISNTIATIPGILCGPVTASLVTASDGKWLSVFLGATFINLSGAFIYFTNSVATQEEPFLLDEKMLPILEFTHGTLTPPQSPPCEPPMLTTLEPLLAPATYPIIPDNKTAVYSVPEKQLLTNDCRSAVPFDAEMVDINYPPVTTPQPDIAHELAVVDELVRTRVEDMQWSSSSSSPGSPGSSSCSNYGDCSSDDPEWVPETIEIYSNNEVPIKTPRKRSKPYSKNPPEEKKVRKKEQNKNAATRYRLKKKAEVEEILSEEKSLLTHHTDLEVKITDLQREIKYLKSLMRDLFKAKGLIN